ncbi:unnamed protein product [Calicophoron daubneyi]|uniref:C2H2-type domain-containing protein n=1 Tax=Calicophoron daubneyi TaxID=300641 RepID=A0AAV2U0T1_CALDB
MLDPMFLTESNQSFNTPAFAQPMRQMTSTHFPFIPTMETNSDAHSLGASMLSVDSPAEGSDTRITNCASSSSGGSNVTSAPQPYLPVCLKQEAEFSGKQSPAVDVPSEHMCNVCGKVFSERSHLQRHRVAHAEAKYVCDTCGRAFVREDKLKRHVRCVHSQERPFICETCSKGFARKDKLQEHARHHNRDITFLCPVCSDVFVMRSHLNRHLRTVHKLKTNMIQAMQSSTSSPAVENTFLTIGDPPPCSCSTSVPDCPSKVLTQISTNTSEKLPAPRRKSLKRPRPNSSRKVDSDLQSLKLECTENQPSDQLQSQPWPPLGAPILGGGAGVSFPANFLFCQQPAVQQQSVQQIGQSSQQLPRSFQLQQQQQQEAITAQGRQSLELSHVPSQSDVTSSCPYSSNGLLQQSCIARGQSQQQQQQQQHQQHSQQQSAFSAAMAAGLFSPVNYVGFWPQPSAGLVLPHPTAYGALGTQSDQFSVGNHSSAFPIQSGCPQSNGVSQYNPCSTLADNGRQETSNVTAQYSSVIPGYVRQEPNPNSAFVRPTPSASSAHMFASFPSFAQAVYYQAASLAASQNGSASTDGSLSSVDLNLFPGQTRSSQSLGSQLPYLSTSSTANS